MTGDREARSAERAHVGWDPEAWVGTPFGEPRVGVPVNEAMIGHWCLALGDTNPRYPAEAPPTMLDVWTMPELVHDLLAEGGFPYVMGDHVLRALDAEGFTSVVATNCEQTYERYLRPGDVVTATRVVDAISPLKRTGMGEGHFVTMRYTYTDQAGEVVGTQLFRLFKFKAPTKRPPRPSPVVTPHNAFFWEGVARGELLVQRCLGCKALRNPPRPMCPACHSTVADAVASSGRGTVVSWTRPRHPQMEAFGDYVVILVELDEGVRLVSNLVDGEPSIDQRVEVVFAEGLPLFRGTG